MAGRYFVDSWYLIASVDPLDGHHSHVTRLARVVANARMFTHDGVFAEVLAFFSDEGARLRAGAAQTIRRAMHRMEVVPSSGLFNAALDLYEARPDKEYSLVDCISMHLMRARGIQHVLTNDHHFRQEGFIVLSDAP